MNSSFLPQCRASRCRWQEAVLSGSGIEGSDASPVITEMLVDVPGLKLAVVSRGGQVLPSSLSDAKKWDYDGSRRRGARQLENLGPQHYHKLVKLRDEPTL